PYIKAPTRDQQAKLAELQTARDRAKQRFQALQPQLDELQRDWEGKDVARLPLWEFTRHQIVKFPLHDLVRDSFKLKKQTGRPALGPLASVRLDGKSWLDAGTVGGFGFFDKSSIGARVYPANGSAGAILSRMVDSDRADGYRLAHVNGKLHVEFVKRWLDDAIRVETVESLRPEQ